MSLLFSPVQINKIYVLIIAIIVVAVAAGGIIIIDRSHSSTNPSNFPGGSGSGSNKLSPGTLTVTVDKTINDQAYDDFMVKAFQSAGENPGNYGLSVNKTKILYNITVSYSGVGTAFFSWASIQVHTTQGIANSSLIVFNGITKFFNDGAFVYLNNSQSASGQIGACLNSSATATSITVQSAVLFNNLADASVYHQTIYAQTTTIPPVTSYLSVLSNPENSFYYPEIMLDGNQTDTAIQGWSPAKGVYADPENISDPFAPRNSSIAYIYTNEVISETFKIGDSSSTTYFQLTGVSGNVQVSVENLPQNTEAKGYFYLTVYITGPDSAFSGPLVINLTGSFLQN